MGNGMPLVSIIIPVYNGANFCREAIDSALNQDYPNCEILVINDGSTDETEEIALSYGSKIRYFHKPNGGVATALNLGINQMRGEYFSWLSHDDLYTPDKISSQMRLLSELEDKTTIISGGWQLINENGDEIGRVIPTMKFSEKQLSTPLFPLLNGMISAIELLIHKSHFERVGIFKEELRTTQDFELLFRMMRGQSVKFINGVIAKMRLHPNQGTKTIASTIAECNTLWIGMASLTTDEEKIEVGGSIKNFYINLYIFLRNATPYKDAAEFVKKRALMHMPPVVGNITVLFIRLRIMAKRFFGVAGSKGLKAVIKQIAKYVLRRGNP